MEAKKLFGYAAAMSLLAFGFASCEPEKNEEEPQTGPTATVRFSVEVTEVTETSAKAEVTVRGDEAATWYAFVTEDLDTDADDLITSAVGELSDIESVLKTGNGEVEFTELTAGTDYRVIVTGLAADGTVSGRAADEEFATSRDPNAWSVAEGWTVQYIERGLQDMANGTQKYGDLVAVVVPEDYLDYFTYAAISVSDFESMYGSDVATLANETIDELNAVIEMNNTYYPEYPISINDVAYTGPNVGIVLDPLDEDEYYVFVFGIAPNGLYGTGNGLYAQSEAFTPMIEESTPEYEKWLGQWDFSGTGTLGTNNDGEWTYEEVPVTTTVTISEAIPNYSYNMVGWQYDLWENEDGTNDAELFPVTVLYDSNSTGIRIQSNEEYGQMNLGGGLYGDLCFLGVFHNAAANQDTFVTGGPYDIATLSLTSDNEAELATSTLELMGGTMVTSVGMEYCVIAGQSVYSYPGIVYPSFDGVKVTRHTGTSASSAVSPAVPTVRKAVKALSSVPAAKTYFPMKFSYMVK